MVHLFEFVAGFVLAMMVELCWHNVMSVSMVVPRYIVRFFSGSTEGGAKVHLVALVWFMIAIVGAALFVVRLMNGAWWQAATIGAGAAMWVAYAMTSSRVHEIMHAERRTQPEQE